LSSFPRTSSRTSPTGENMMVKLLGAGEGLTYKVVKTSEHTKIGEECQTMNPESTHSLFLPAMSQSGTSAHSEGSEKAGQPIEDDNSTSSRENARDGGLNPDKAQALNDSDVLFLESRVRTLENDVKALSAQLMDSQTELAVIREARDKYRDLYTRFAKRHEEPMVRLNTAEREREAAAKDRERLQVFLKTCCEENNEDAYSLG
ncbi:hypothetical protein FOZ63_013465, partial [Perkinsus olseni]